MPMNTTGGIQGMMPNVSTTGLLKGVLITLVVIMVLGAIAYWTWWRFRKKRYNQYKVIIWEKDSTGNTHEHYDRAGVFLDRKTGFKLLFLENLKIGLNPNNVPYVTAKDKKGRLIKTIYLRKIGVSNYVFCHVKLANDGMIFTVGEEDANWLEQEMEKIRRTFGKQNWLEKFAPYIMFIITIMIIMIIMISLFNKFTVLKDTSDNLVKISEQQSVITSLLFNMTQNPVINNNMPIIVPGGGGK